MCPSCGEEAPKGCFSSVIDAQSAAKALANLVQNSKQSFRIHSRHELQRDKQEAPISWKEPKKVMHSG
jgi:hypothetical protein